MSHDGGNIDEAVLTVLRDAIGNDAISVTDDFYEAGGYSLLIIRVVRRLSQEFGLVLEARQFAVNSQVAALIAACRPVDG